MQKQYLIIFGLLISSIYCGFKISDVDYDLYPAFGGSANLQDNGYTLVLNGNSRFYVAQGGSYKSFNLLGASLSFDVEGLGNAGCGCNIAFYGVQLSKVGYGDYCDGNGVGGKWCPEMDFMEGNAHSLHVTPHCCCSGGCDGTDGGACLNSNQGSYSVCDRWGYGGGFGGNNAPSTRFSQSYGPGQYIDTNQKFTYTANIGSNGELSVTLTQNGKTSQMTFTNQNYLSKFANPMSDMGFVFSSWDNSDMTWLDGGEGGCRVPESCNLDNMNVRISNMKVVGGGGPAPGPAPGPTPSGDYTYGNSCAHNNDGLCGNSCSDCRWSWPTNDPAQWNSKDANCRCKSAAAFVETS